MASVVPIIAGHAAIDVIIPRTISLFRLCNGREGMRSGILSSCYSASEDLRWEPLVYFVARHLSRSDTQSGLDQSSALSRSILFLG